VLIVFKVNQISILRQPATIATRPVITSWCITLRRWHTIAVNFITSENKCYWREKQRLLAWKLSVTGTCLLGSDSKDLTLLWAVNPSVSLTLVWQTVTQTVRQTDIQSIIQTARHSVTQSISYTEPNVWFNLKSKHKTRGIKYCVVLLQTTRCFTNITSSYIVVYCTPQDRYQSTPRYRLFRPTQSSSNKIVRTSTSFI
jgi:hypothetical protein